MSEKEVQKFEMDIGAILDIIKNYFNPVGRN